MRNENPEPKGCCGMERLHFDLDDLHRVQVALLKSVIRVCQVQDLTWFLGFGSLLGAVREGEIIPWDDSIDVVMPYADYDKLVHLPQEVWGEGLFMQTVESDPQYPRCYAKLRDSRTTLIQSDYVDYDINHGIYINIMPLINLADIPELRRRQMRAARLYRALTERQASCGAGVFERLYASLLISATPLKHRKEKLACFKTEIIRYCSEKTECCFAFAGSISLSLALPVEWFKSAEECEFEGLKVKIPHGWKEWLSLRYGDYMTAPIADLQGDKLARFVTLNTEKPYTHYKGTVYCCNR